MKRDQRGRAIRISAYMPFRDTKNDVGGISIRRERKSFEVSLFVAR